MIGISTERADQQEELARPRRRGLPDRDVGRHHQREDADPEPGEAQHEPASAHRNGVRWCSRAMPRGKRTASSATRIGTGLVSRMPGQPNQRCMKIGLRNGVHRLTATISASVASPSVHGLSAGAALQRALGAPDQPARAEQA